MMMIHLCFAASPKSRLILFLPFNFEARCMLETQAVLLHLPLSAFSPCFSVSVTFFLSNTLIPNASEAFSRRWWWKWQKL